MHQYLDKGNKIGSIILVCIVIGTYIWFFCQNQNRPKTKKNKDREWIEILNNPDYVICPFIYSLSLSSYFGYSTLPYNLFNVFSDYCNKNFGFSCGFLKFSNIIVLIFGLVTTTVFLIISILISLKVKTNLLRVIRVFRFFRWAHMILITVFPAIMSGYLLSTNPRTTKIAFGICIISFTRLVDHFGDKPEEVNTAISVYVNLRSDESQINIENLTEEVENLTSKIKKQMIEVKKQTDEIKIQIKLKDKEEIDDQKLEIEIKNLIKELAEKLSKLNRERIDEIENLIKELTGICKQKNESVKINIDESTDPTDPTEMMISQLKNEIIEIEVLKDEINRQIGNMKELKEAIRIKEQQTKKNN